MPKSRTSWYKVANYANVLLGFIASIPINLITSWLQQDIISNKFLTIFVIILLAAICYLVVRIHAPKFLIDALMGFVAGIYAGLFSVWLQGDVLHNSFTSVNVPLMVLVTLIILVLGSFIASRPIKTYVRRKRDKRRREAKKGSISLASRGKVNTTKKPRTPRKKTRQGFW